MNRATSIRLLVMVILTCGMLLSRAQSFVWARGEGGIGNEAANGIAADENGNVYITGNLAGMADFSGTVYQGRGLYDVIIAKYNAAGTLVWLKMAGGEKNDQGNAIRYQDGFLYIGGYFTDTAWFENTMLTARGESDGFVAKYDLNGNLQWVRSGGGPKVDYVSSLDVDATGNVYAAGTYESYSQWDTVHLATSNFFTESFVCKYAPNGQLQWAKSTHGTNANIVTGIVHDQRQALYLTGFFGADFSIDTLMISSNSPSYDIFLARLTNDGQVQWLQRAGSNYEDAANGITVDPTGQPIITGYFAGIAHFGTHTVTYYDYNDVFTAKYDTAGNNLWVRTGKGLQLDVGYAVTTDADANVYTTGMFQGAADFDGYSLTGTDRDIFVVSYDPDGNRRWITQAGGQNTDCPLGLTLTPGGRVALCGYYLYTCTFGNLPVGYANSNDMFVAEYQPPVVNALSPLPSSGQVGVYPNPVQRELRIITPGVTTPLHYRIWDLTGRLLQTGDVDPAGTIDLGPWAPGMYRLELTEPGTRHLIAIEKW